MEVWLVDCHRELELTCLFLRIDNIKSKFINIHARLEAYCVHAVSVHQLLDIPVEPTKVQPLIVQWVELAKLRCIKHGNIQCPTHHQQIQYGKCYFTHILF